MSTERQLRVLQVSATMHIGGAENVVVELAERLDRSRFEVALCCTRELGVLAERLRAKSVEVLLAAPADRRLRHFTPLFLHRAIARFQPDIVHTHSTPTLLHAGPLAALGLLPRWVHTFHFGNYDSATRRQMRGERLFCRLPNELIAVSESQRQSIIRFHGLPPDRIRTIPNGVAPNPSVNQPEGIKRRRRELGFTDSDIIVGCVAVLSEQKGVTYLLKGAARFMAQDPRIRLLIIGGGPAEKALRAEARALNLAAVFTGWRPDALDLLPVLDVFVMSSLWEAMPMALLEAMAARRPIVVTDVGDNKQIVDGGRCALVVPKANADAIAAAVLGLTSDPRRASALGALALQRFMERFTTTRMVSTYEALYEKICAMSTGRSVAVGRLASGL